MGMDAIAVEVPEQSRRIFRNERLLVKVNGRCQWPSTELIHAGQLPAKAQMCAMSGTPSTNVN